MLPYFSFPKRPDTKDDEEAAVPVVTSNELMPKAKISVEFYANLFETERTFDEFYTLGWDPFFNLGYFKDGAGPQRNPPLAPELVTATAIADFFQKPPEPKAAADGAIPVLVSARRAKSSLRWRDIPRGDCEAKLGQLIRFACYWRYKVKPALRNTRLISIRRGLKERWLGDVGVKADIQKHLVDEEALDTYLNQVLIWAAGMERWSEGAWRPGLWTLAGYLGAEQPKLANEDRVLADLGDEQGGEVLRDDDGEFRQRTFETIYGDLTTHAARLAAGPHKGLGRAVAAAFQASHI